jgi:glucose-1-phosphate adenylyltransferase
MPFGGSPSAMDNVLSLVLGGGRGPMLYPLTKARSKAAVPLAGKYRFIDIPLSNCLNSGLNRIYVLTQFQSVSLHRHIANTYKFDPFGRGFIEVLAAQLTNEAADWYRGTADAIRQNARYLQEEGARDILILSDDQLYRIDFRLLVKAHHDSHADFTIAVAPVSHAQARTLGVLSVDDTGAVTSFVEKPQAREQLDCLRTPAPWLAARGVKNQERAYLGNMGIYLFRREMLLKLLHASPLGHDLTADLFTRMLREYKTHAYFFDGYWEHLDTIRSYHEAHMALASDSPPFDFHSPEGVIYTRMRNLPASRVSAGRLEHCLVSDGCVIGPRTTLERCVIGVRSVIGSEVVARDAVIMGANFYETLSEQQRSRERGIPPLGIGADSILERVIVDKHCRIGRNVRIENRSRVSEADGDNYVIRDGIVVIPDGAVIPDGTVI